MADTNRKFLIFSLHDSLYALDMSLVAEVGDPPRLSPIPLAPACYCGALNFHGSIVAAVNLALLFGLTGGCRPGKIIVLAEEVASLAFLVDSLHRIVSEEEVSFETLADNPFAVTSMCMREGAAILLDIASLIHEAENGMQGVR